MNKEEYIKQRIMLNSAQAEELFKENAVLLGESDCMTCCRAAELLSEEAVEFAASFETAKPGTHFNLFYVKKGRKSYSVKYLTYKGFQEAVSYYNASEILAEGATADRKETPQHTTE